MPIPSSCTDSRAGFFAGLPAKGPACWPISTCRSPLPPPPYSRVNPRLHTYRRVTDRCVGAGSPAKGPGLLANFHPTFTVAAATVFAGKPAPTHA
ncbi:hypothetical protein EQ845_28520 [Pseudomonas putida]|nr:hypothetical protein EQ845_28520 [Pseudomonas putida]